LENLIKWLKAADRAVISEIAELAGVNRTVYDADARNHAYNEGFRSFGLKLLALAETEVTEVVTENYKKRNLKWKKT
jgi:hypothetical protein